MEHYDDLIDTLHEIGRCGCDNCHANPNMTIVNKPNTKKVIIEFDVPDRRISVTGTNLNDACEQALKSINVKTGATS